MIRLCVALLSFILVVGAAPPAVYAQEPPPPTPTLAPIVGPDPSATQTLQLQEFARDAAYLVRHTTTYTTTSTGAPWSLERRVTYGEASVVVMLMVVALLQIGGLVYRFAAKGGRR